MTWQKFRIVKDWCSRLKSSTPTSSKSAVKASGTSSARLIALRTSEKLIRIQMDSAGTVWKSSKAMWKADQATSITDLTRTSLTEKKASFGKADKRWSCNLPLKAHSIKICKKQRKTSTNKCCDCRLDSKPHSCRNKDCNRLACKSSRLLQVLSPCLQIQSSPALTVFLTLKSFKKRDTSRTT